MSVLNALWYILEFCMETQEKLARPIRSVKPRRKKREIVENKRKEARYIKKKKNKQTNKQKARSFSAVWIGFAYAM